MLTKVREDPSWASLGRRNENIWTCRIRQWSAQSPWGDWKLPPCISHHVEGERTSTGCMIAHVNLIPWIPWSAQPGGRTQAEFVSSDCNILRHEGLNVQCRRHTTPRRIHLKYVPKCARSVCQLKALSVDSSIHSLCTARTKAWNGTMYYTFHLLYPYAYICLHALTVKKTQPWQIYCYCYLPTTFRIPVISWRSSTTSITTKMILHSPLSTEQPAWPLSRPQMITETRKIELINQRAQMLCWWHEQMRKMYNHSIWALFERAWFPKPHEVETHCRGWIFYNDVKRNDQQSTTNDECVTKNEDTQWKKDDWTIRHMIMTSIYCVCLSWY